MLTSRDVALRFAGLASLLLARAAVAAEAPAAGLDAEIATILPSEQENRWMEIPWRSNIMEAIEEAHRVNKPVFLWVMNGNPLGCA